jgi:predicted esterase
VHGHGHGLASLALHLLDGSMVITPRASVWRLSLLKAAAFLSAPLSCASAGVPPSAVPASAAVVRFETSERLEEPFVALPVPGHEPAVVSVPQMGTGRRPLLVAAHGAWDRPEPHCALWRRLVGGRAFILCLRGQRTLSHVPHSHAAYYYPHHFALAREALAAINALAARYPEQLDPTAAVFAGFSQGAIQGALVAVLHPKVFPRAVLIEGGNGFFNEWSPFAARQFARGGGKRVLFGCGSPACVRTATRCAGYLERSKVDTRVLHAQGAGHSYGSIMEARLRENFSWLVADDPRWSVD